MSHAFTNSEHFSSDLVPDYFVTSVVDKYQLYNMGDRQLMPFCYSQ